MRYHHRILAEIEARDPDLAAAVMGRHINDFRAAWEHAGLDFDTKIADIEDNALLPPLPTTNGDRAGIHPL